MADQFALILTAMVPQNLDRPQARILEQLLYHLGRWIYLIDAWDDLEDDLSKGRYNPVVSRFHLRGAPEEKRMRPDRAWSAPSAILKIWRFLHSI